MISSIGRQKLLRDKAGFTPTPICDSTRNSKLVWGFTLIELILISIISLIIIGLSIPLFKKTYSDLRVSLQAKDMTSLMNLARENAIMTRIPHAIKIDTDKKNYRMLKIDLEKDRVIPIEGKWGRRFYISRNLKVDSSKDTIEFFTDGSSNGAVILFEDITGSKKQINVEAGTGEITVGEIQER